MNSSEEIAALIKGLQSAVIFPHTRPDGDALGCAGALCLALRRLGKRCEIVCDSEIPERYLFLPVLKEVRTSLSSEGEGADAFLCVDASDDARLGDLTPVFRRGAKKKITVNIDHHISNTRFCRYNFVRERASNAENIADIIALLGVPMDKEIADCILAGVITDSGAFSHGDVNGDTFRTAAAAADAGGDVNAVSYELYRKQTKARAQLYAEAISSLYFTRGDKIAIALVTQEMLSRYGLKGDATEGIVDFALNIDTVEVSVCLLESGKGQYKASLRSKGKTDVNRVAATFGGGGHRLAAGCMFFCPPEEILDKLRYAIWQNTEEA